MPRVHQYLKNIVCLESLWDDDLENRLSMLPILELAARTTNAKFVCLTCNTKAELRHNLSLFGKRKSYGILVMAFHGDCGKIELPGHILVSLESLSDMMKRQFAGWMVHFATCDTVRVEEARIARFVEETGVAVVTGYTREVDWIEGSIMDLLLLRWVQYYRNMGALLRHLMKNYPDLIRLTGLMAYPPAASRS
jgi:hypothetical protein